MNNVLIIEDDKEICVMIKDHLEKYNYQVFFTLTGANAIERIKELSPDLIILDLMLPFISGDELIRNIRKFSDVPVIVVSAKSLTFNKVELLRLGADDYLTKPFDLDELLARIERNLLRSQKDTPNLCLTFGELSINTSSKIVTVADEIIVLTAKEYQLVELLAKYPDKVFSKQNLYESIWQEPFARDNDFKLSVIYLVKYQRFKLLPAHLLHIQPFSGLLAFYLQPYFLQKNIIRVQSNYLLHTALNELFSTTPKRLQYWWCL